MIALWMLGIAGAWAQDTCAEIYAQTCGGVAQQTSGVSLDIKLRDCVQDNDSTCCWNVDDTYSTFEPQADTITASGTQDRDLVLFFGDGGAIDAITLDSQRDLCSGSGRCFLRSLTLCALPEAAPATLGTSVAVTGLSTTLGGPGFVVRELRFDGGALSATGSDVVLSDLALRNTPVSIDDNTGSSSPLELTRLMSCGDEPGLTVQGLSVSSHPAVVRGSLFAGTGDHLVEVRGASFVTLENNHFIGATDGALHVPGAGQLIGQNNLFVYAPGVLPEEAPDPFGQWSHNGGWQVDRADHLSPDLIPNAAPFAYSTPSVTCSSGALAALYDAWPTALGSRDLIPTADSLLALSGRTSAGPTTGQPANCTPDIGAFGGPYALPAMWAGNDDADCLEPERDCDDGSADYLNVYLDQDGDSYVSDEPTCLTPSDGDRTAGDDCDDTEDDIHPDLPDDDCDRVDDDCDGVADQGAQCSGDDTADPDDTDNSDDTGIPGTTGCSGWWWVQESDFTVVLLLPLLGWGLARRRDDA
ncbi:MAG: hypothetical protein H6739_17755 [Alphaproteobacteria bacterium]|nr:hypothetical protein [Alphaproteobacteria bacterium]